MFRPLALGAEVDDVTDAERPGQESDVGIGELVDRVGSDEHATPGGPASIGAKSADIPDVHRAFQFEPEGGLHAELLITEGVSEPIFDSRPIRVGETSSKTSTVAAPLGGETSASFRRAARWRSRLGSLMIANDDETPLRFIASDDDEVAQ
jgi:hypothetical protein